VPAELLELDADAPRALVLRAAGVNCDVETAHAFRQAGARPQRLHINRLAENPRLLEDFDLLAIPGGFSYGDDIAAGRILADQLNRTLGDELLRFVEAGKPVIGICNGFQVLVQTRLLGEVKQESGGLKAEERRSGASAFPDRLCTLAENAQGRFICRWIRLEKVAAHCVWTQGWGADEQIELPIAHAEGRLVFRDERARDLLEDAGRVALRYTGVVGGDVPDLPPNPNGSTNDIAALCDESGLVLGLMPHPERYTEAVQHPAFARRRADGGAEVEPAGIRLFRSAVDHVAARV
jgi:phosphoribosylformylglycinamidine synthase